MEDDRIETRAIHAGSFEPIEGAITTPIFQSATYLHSGAGVYRDVRYVRLSNTPNHQVLGRRLANLCGGEAAIVTSSGMSAITTTMLALLKQGDHMIVQRCLYGGTQAFLKKDAPALGIEVTAVDGDDPASWEAALKPNTRMVYLEALSNPLLEIPDLKGAIQFAKAHNLYAVVDNTFPSPVNFRPLEHGFDLVVHSATKYLNGHSDIAAGCVVGKAHLVERVLDKLLHYGGCLDPNSCFLLERGLKTLPLRVAAQNANALALATYLESHPKVERVIYPSLASHPEHARANALFKGGGGVLSLVLKGSIESADTVIKHLRIPQHAPSLGGVETLITRPSTTSHADMTPEQRKASGVPEGLIRIACGIEAAEDLIADFAQALQAAAS